MPATTYGMVYPFDARPGYGMQDALTGAPNAGSGLNLPAAGAPSATVAGVVNPGDDSKPRPNYLAYLLAVVGILAAMKFASERDGSDMNPSFTRVGFFNFVTVGFMSVLFIVVFKTLANLHPIRGITDIANAV